MKRIAIVVPASLALLLLAGCSAAPSRDEVSERFLIEFTDDDAFRDAMQESADQLAGSALDGYCGDEGFEAGLRTTADEQIFYAWRTTCLMYFEDDLSQSQVNETKQMIMDRVSGS
ncbi:hypothetical protein [Microbacterium sp. UBA3486]|uniref:hypothetical protein n=1 Tax=Microbacterium TaxID=33882 RepID=UPI0025E256FD|nr:MULTISPECIES: hypothetical protein [Microbacterium]